MGAVALFRGSVNIKAGVAFIAACMVAAGTARAIVNPPPPSDASGASFGWVVSGPATPAWSDSSATALNTFFGRAPASAARPVKFDLPAATHSGNLEIAIPSYRVSYILGDVEMLNAAQNIKTAYRARYENDLSARADTPLLRISPIKVTADADDRNIPYVAHFNDWPNL